ncbi:MAG: response regulator transcription factor [Gemmatimonadaceae bacterium]
MQRDTPSGGIKVGARTIRVVIADDHAVVREGLRVLVSAQPGLEVIGEAGDGQEAWKLACELQPDVIVLDLSMPVMGGAETAERISKECADVRILALTMHEERGYVSRLLRAGAAGYLLKRSASSELVRAIRAVAWGGSYVDPSLAASLLVEPAHSAHASASARQHRAAVPDLTPRELETLRLVARGHSNKEIAATLEIGVKTVETHRANAMAKLGLGSRAALVRFALDEGWLA